MAATSEKFREWLKRQKASEVAKRCDVTPGAIYPWRDGKIIPRHTHAWILVNMSAGELTIEDIFVPPTTNA